MKTFSFFFELEVGSWMRWPLLSTFSRMPYAFTTFTNNFGLVMLRRILFVYLRRIYHHFFFLSTILHSILNHSYSNRIGLIDRTPSQIRGECIRTQNTVHNNKGSMIINKYIYVLILLCWKCGCWKLSSATLAVSLSHNLHFNNLGQHQNIPEFLLVDKMSIR